MWQRLKTFWGSLPHPLQATLVSAATVAGTAFVHALSEGDCFSTACLKHYAFTSLAAGAVVIKAFYMTPSNKTPTA